MRSEDAAELAKLDARAGRDHEQGRRRREQSRSTKAGEVKVDPKVIGERPAGRTDPRLTMIVRLAEASIRANGFTPGLEISSTDSNMPMSLGIPAITLGSGGQAGRALRALDEWIDVERGPSVKGALAGLTTVMALGRQ